MSRKNAYLVQRSSTFWWPGTGHILHIYKILEPANNYRIIIHTPQLMDRIALIQEPDFAMKRPYRRVSPHPISVVYVASGNFPLPSTRRSIVCRDTPIGEHCLSLFSAVARDAMDMRSYLGLKYHIF